jgi:hypothetical protein
MNKELSRKLHKKFPFFKGHYGWGLPFECMDGWFQLIWDLSEELEQIAKEEGIELYVSQVKSKYGTLRYYLGAETDRMSDVIDRYEEISAHTCEVCGKEGHLALYKGWWDTLCYWHWSKLKFNDKWNRMKHRIKSLTNKRK